MIAQTPVRLQLSRRGGSNLQATSRARNGLEAVNVARPSAWGNHAPVKTMTDQITRVVDNEILKGARREAWIAGTDVIADTEYAELGREAAVTAFAIEMRRFKRLDPVGFEAFVAPLRGKNLACWCGPFDRCHADVLLSMANSTAGADGFVYTPLGREARNG